MGGAATPHPSINAVQAPFVWDQLTRNGGACAMAASLLEHIPQTIPRELLSLVDDIVAVVLERNPTGFLKAHDVQVDGTEQSLVIFEFDALAFGIAFDAEFRTAMRARGFELPRGNDIGHLSHS